jgi:hypothetical protein
VADYVTPDQLAAQLGLRDPAAPRLAVVCTVASDEIDGRIGRTTRFDPVPATINEVALSLAVDWWKQPDSTFGVLGLNETGPVRIGRDLLARYDPALARFTEPNGWGVA